MALHAVELEGIVESVLLVGQGAELHIMGLAVVIDGNAFPGAARDGRVKTPTVTLTAQQLTDPTPLPARTAAGFAGATAIVAGNYDPADGRVHVRLQTPPGNQGAVPFESNPTVLIEPAETVLVGPVTKNDPAGFDVNGVPVLLLTDARLVADPPRSEFGFPIRLETVPLLAPATIEGYYGNNGVFQAFVVEADGALVIDPAVTPQISIMRAEARNEGASYRLRLRGAVTTAHVTNLNDRAVIEIYRIDDSGDTFLASTSAAIGGNPAAVRWDLDDEFIALPAPLNAPPASIRVKYASAPNQAEATSTVEIREE